MAGRRQGMSSALAKIDPFRSTWDRNDPNSIGQELDPYAGLTDPREGREQLLEELLSQVDSAQGQSANVETQMANIRLSAQGRAGTGTTSSGSSDAEFQAFLRRKQAQMQAAQARKAQEQAIAAARARAQAAAKATALHQATIARQRAAQQGALAARQAASRAAAAAARARQTGAQGGSSTLRSLPTGVFNLLPYTAIAQIPVATKTAPGVLVLADGSLVRGTFKPL